MLDAALWPQYPVACCRTAPMLDVFNLVIPFFGLIFLGFIVAKFASQPVEALGWMNLFIIYVALPALFFKLISETPIEQLASWRFVLTTTLSTFLIFLLMFAIAMRLTRGNFAESTIQGLAAAYGNIGYMGPGLALLALGPAASVPVALIFCFENALHFTVAPTMMALSGKDRRGKAVLAVEVVKKIVTHPFMIATFLGVVAAAFEFRPAEPIARLIAYLSNAAAPCALFAMGVSMALRPLKRVPTELFAILPIKLAVQPMLVYLLLSWTGNYPPVWVFTAVLMAGLPTATNVFVLAQQYQVWMERASASVLTTTVASVGTVTLLLYAITKGYLPADLFPG
jgi:malonate transporter and related proteins